MQKGSFLHRNSILLTLLLFFSLAIFLRIFLLQQNLFFGPEQGIDFLVIKDIVVNHNFTLIGAKTDISGIFHGPIYYYISVIPFFLSQGNPLFISFFLIIINCLSVFFIYALGKISFNTRVGLIAAALFTCSYTAIVYARWLSTHPLAIPLVCLYFLFLIKFLKGNTVSLWGAALFLGLLMQSEFLNILFFGVITLVILIIFFKEFTKQNKSYLIVSGMIAATIGIGHLVLFDFRHDFLITKNIFLLTHKDIGYHTSYIMSLISSLRTLIDLVASIIVPFSFIIALVSFSAAILLLVREKTNKYRLILFSWLFVPPLILIFLGHEILDQFFVALIPAIILSIAFLIDTIWRKKYVLGVLLLFVYILFNLVAWITNIPQNNKIFFQAPQLDFKYSNQLAVIDEIYKRADGKPFSIQAYTIPYWTQQGWQYLFWQYGLPKYGYLPIEQKASLLFVIVQDDPGNKDYQQDWLKKEVSKWGSLKDEFSFGNIAVKELHVVY